MSCSPRARPTIDSPRLQSLHAYWNDRRAGRDMPARSDIDPIDIPRLLPNLLLIDVEPGTRRLKVRVAGTTVVEMYGSDYTGRYLDEIDFGDRRAAVLFDYNTCLETRQPYAAEHSFWTDRGITYRIERLILPLSDDGETVSQLIAGLEFDTVR